jgi:transposase InsO family protein
LQSWKTFLRNHMEGIASIDLFVVPTIAFQRLFAFLVLGHERRGLLWFAVTRNPTADWLARQITEAFPWDGAPKYLIRDNDRVFGAVFKAHVRAMGIRDRPTSFRSPWQNGYVERLIGSIRRECTDHALMALGFGLTFQSMPADAQHYASKQKAQRPKSDAELIASATSAAPPAVTKDATIVAVGSDGKLRTLRQGQGAFTLRSR